MFIFPSLSLVTLWLILLAYCQFAVGGSSGEAGILTTSACDTVREYAFRARLDLFYYYSLEYVNGTEIDLNDVQLAIAYSLVDVFDECNENGQPKVAVELSQDKHELSHGGLCSPIMEGDLLCEIVKGVTSIYLDDGSPDVHTVAFNVVERSINDTNYLTEFTSANLVYSEFIRAIGDSLVLIGKESDFTSRSPTGTAVIATATACLSFLFTGMFFYSIYRSKGCDSKDGSTIRRLAHYHAKRRHYFQELEEDQEESFKTIKPPQVQGASVTWSVSDLTSDSHSIRSNYPLDRIDEECPQDEDEIVSNPPSPKRDFMQQGHLDFIAHWNEGLSTRSIPSELASHSPTVLLDMALNPEFWEEDLKSTPVMSSHIEDYDITADTSRYLNGSSETSFVTASSDPQNPRNSNDDAMYFAAVALRTPERPDDSTTASSRYCVPTGHLASGYFMILDDPIALQWFQKLLSELDRARTQKRIAD